MKKIIALILFIVGASSIVYAQSSTNSTSNSVTLSKGRKLNKPVELQKQPFDSTRETSLPILSTRAALKNKKHSTPVNTTPSDNKKLISTGRKLTPKKTINQSTPK